MVKKINQTKLFVIDTNVLLHDPSCLFRFEEHDIYLPMVTIEELDNNKKGSSEVARNARQTHRFLEEIIGPFTGIKQYRCKLCIVNILIFTESKAYRIFTGSNKMHAPISFFDNSFFILSSRYNLN